MRVCPLCEFIYEDDQSLCDMDGSALVYDPAPLALAQADAPKAAAPRSTLRRYAATAATGIVLGIVLVLVFLVFTFREQEEVLSSVPRDVNHSSERFAGDSILDLSLPVPLVFPGDEVPMAVPRVDPLPTPVSSAVPKSPSRQSAQGREKSTSNVFPRSDARVVSEEFTRPGGQTSRSFPSVEQPASGPSRPLTGNLPEQQSRTEMRPMEAPRKGSRLSSFLKKTGRILKKPFSG